MAEQDVSISGMVFMTTGTPWCLVIAVFAFSFDRRLLCLTLNWRLQNLIPDCFTEFQAAFA